VAYGVETAMRLELLAWLKVDETHASIFLNCKEKVLKDLVKNT